MLIIAGKLYIESKSREEYLTNHEDFIRRARTRPGCLDFIIAADPVEVGRVNLFERWESEESLRTWQAEAEPPKSVPQVMDEEVKKYDISASGSVFP